MIGIGVATAAAGIIVVTVTRTLIGTELSGLVEQLSGGIVSLMPVPSGLFSLVLVMGLPTTANGVAVSSLTAPVSVSPRRAGRADRSAGRRPSRRGLRRDHGGWCATGRLRGFRCGGGAGGDTIRTGFTAVFDAQRTLALPFPIVVLIRHGVDPGRCGHPAGHLHLRAGDLRE